MGVWAHGGGHFNLSLAVSFFFELSGFILTYVYPELETWEQRGRFLLARFARIWPAHLAAFGLLWLLLQTPAQFPTRYASVGLGILNLSLVQGWVPVWNVFFSFNPVSWTISTEFFFYLACLFLYRNWRGTWWWKLALMLGLAVGAIVLCQVLKLPEGSGEHPWAASSTGVLYIHPVARVFEFTLGMCIALVFRKSSGRVQISKAVGTVMEVGAVGLVVVNMYYVNDIIALFIRWFPNWPVGTWVSVGPCCCLSFMVLIYVMAMHTGYLSRVLGTPVGVLLGEISYSVYLTHYVLVTFYRIHDKAFALGRAWGAYRLLGGVVLVRSWVVGGGIERPLRVWIVSRWPKRQREKAPSDAPPVAVPRFSLLQPRWPGVLVGVFVLLGVCYPAYRAIAHADAAEIEAMRGAFVAGSREVRFDKKLELLGATMERQGDGVALALAWQTIGAIPADTVIAVHLVDDAGKILAQRDYELHPTVSRPSPVAWLSVVDPFWVDRVEIPGAALNGVTRVAIAVYHKKGGMEVVDRGERDWDGHRLLLGLPAK